MRSFKSGDNTIISHTSTCFELVFLPASSSGFLCSHPEPRKGKAEFKHPHLPACISPPTRHKPGSLTSSLAAHSHASNTQLYFILLGHRRAAARTGTACCPPARTPMCQHCHRHGGCRAVPGLQLRTRPRCVCGEYSTLQTCNDPRVCV